MRFRGFVHDKISDLMLEIYFASLLHFVTIVPIKIRKTSV